MESGNETEKENKIGFIESVMLLFKNKYFIMLLVWYLVMYLASGVTSGLGIYYTTYKLNNAGLLGTLSMVGMIPAMIILLFVPQLTENLAFAGFQSGEQYLESQEVFWRSSAGIQNSVS